MKLQFSSHENTLSCGHEARRTEQLNEMSLEHPTPDNAYIVDNKCPFGVDKPITFD
jgi:hypothetical protein